MSLIRQCQASVKPPAGARAFAESGSIAASGRGTTVTLTLKVEPVYHTCGALTRGNAGRARRVWKGLWGSEDMAELEPMQRRKRVTGETLSRQVVGSLIEMITQERFATGTLLPSERELCTLLGVSRTVIREALQVLAARGIVTIRQGTGVLVGSPSGGPMRDFLELLLRREGVTLAELLEVRRLLEVEVAGLAAQRSVASDHVAMSRSVQALEMQPGSPEGYVQADVEFHQLIIRAARNRLLTTVTHPITDLLRASRVASFRGAFTIDRTVREHASILHAIEEHDPEAARDAMRVHLAHTEGDFLAQGFSLDAPSEPDRAPSGAQANLAPSVR
jgi:GntR family transcriptional repressor for pyruvate dehydrogenase complex